MEAGVEFQKTTLFEVIIPLLSISRREQLESPFYEEPPLVASMTQHLLTNNGLCTPPAPILPTRGCSRNVAAGVTDSLQLEDTLDSLQLFPFCGRRDDTDGFSGAHTVTATEEGDSCESLSADPAGLHQRRRGKPPQQRGIPGFITQERRALS